MEKEKDKEKRSKRLTRSKRVTRTTWERKSSVMWLSTCALSSISSSFCCNKWEDFNFNMKQYKEPYKERGKKNNTAPISMPLKLRRKMWKQRNLSWGRNRKIEEWKFALTKWVLRYKSKTILQEKKQCKANQIHPTLGSKANPNLPKQATRKNRGNPFFLNRSCTDAPKDESSYCLQKLIKQQEIIGFKLAASKIKTHCHPMVSSASWATKQATDKLRVKWNELQISISYINTLTDYLLQKQTHV